MAEVLDIEVGDVASVAVIHYSCGREAVEIRSSWEHDKYPGRPVIIQVDPAD